MSVFDRDLLTVTHPATGSTDSRNADPLNSDAVHGELSRPVLVQSSLELDRSELDRSELRGLRGRTKRRGRRTLVSRGRRSVPRQLSSSTSVNDSAMLAPESSPENPHRTHRWVPDLGSPASTRSSHAPEPRRTAEDVFGERRSPHVPPTRPLAKRRSLRAREVHFDESCDLNVRLRRPPLGCLPSKELAADEARPLLGRRPLTIVTSGDSRSEESAEAAARIVEQTDAMFRLGRETHPALFLSVFLLILGIVWMGA